MTLIGFCVIIKFEVVILFQNVFELSIWLARIADPRSTLLFEATFVKGVALKHFVVDV